MKLADIQEFLQILIARPPLYMKPEVFAGNEGKGIITWIDSFETVTINNAYDEAKKCRTIPMYLAKSALKFYSNLPETT